MTKSLPRRVLPLLSFAVAASCCPLSARAITISAAKAMPIGASVTLDDVLITSTIDLVDNVNLRSFMVQDDTGAVKAFDANANVASLLSGMAEGDRITITGNTVLFNGLFELGQPLTATLLAQGVGVPAPAVTTTADYQDLSATAEVLENKLVQLLNVRFTGITPGQTFAGETNYTVTDGNRDVIFRIQTNALSLVGDLIPTGPVNLSGVLGQFDPTNPLPGVAGSGYQFQPLDDSSIVPIPEPCGMTLAITAIGMLSVVQRAGGPRWRLRLRGSRSRQEVGFGRRLNQPLAAALPR